MIFCDVLKFNVNVDRRLSTVGMTSTVEKVFRRNYPELVNAIDSPRDFANDFYQAGLITKASRDAATEVDNARLKSDKAAQLLIAVQTMVNTYPDMMSKVIRVLRGHLTTRRLGSKMAAEGKLRILYIFSKNAGNCARLKRNLLLMQVVNFTCINLYSGNSRK